MNSVYYVSDIFDIYNKNTLLAKYYACFMDARVLRFGNVQHHFIDMVTVTLFKLHYLPLTDKNNLRISIKVEWSHVSKGPANSDQSWQSLVNDAVLTSVEVRSGYDCEFVSHRGDFLISSLFVFLDQSFNRHCMDYLPN